MKKDNQHLTEFEWWTVTVMFNCQQLRWIFRLCIIFIHEKKRLQKTVFGNLITPQGLIAVRSYHLTTHSFPTLKLIFPPTHSFICAFSIFTIALIFIIKLVRAYTCNFIWRDGLNNLYSIHKYPWSLILFFTLTFYSHWIFSKKRLFVRFFRYSYQTSKQKKKGKE